MRSAPRGARVSTAAAFLLHACVFGTWVPRIPALKAQVGVDNGELGIALFGLALGLLVGTRLAALPIRRFGSRAALRAGVPLLCAALLGPALAPTFPALLLALLVMGVLGSLVDVAMNAQAVAVERGYGRPIMSGLHGLWSAGGFVAGLAAGLAAGAGLGLRAHFAAAGLVLALASAPALAGLLPADAERALAERAREAQHAALWSRPVLVLGAIVFCSFVAEGSCADWSAVYLHDRLGAGPGLAAAGFVAFSLAMMCSRLAGDRLVSRLGAVTLVRAAGALAAAGLALALTVATPLAAVVGFALFGAGLAPAVPAAVSAAANAGAGPAGVVVGRVFGMGYAGGTLGPVVIGLCAQRVGLRTALLVPVLCALVVAAGAGAARSYAGGSSSMPEVR